MSCGVYPNKFVVRPLHAVSPVIGAYLRLKCYPILRMRHNSQWVPRVPPSSAQPHARQRDREISARSGKGERAIAVQSRIDKLSDPAGCPGSRLVPGWGSLSGGKGTKTRCIDEADVRRTGEENAARRGWNCGELGHGDWR